MDHMLPSFALLSFTIGDLAFALCIACCDLKGRYPSGNLDEIREYRIELQVARDRYQIRAFPMPRVEEGDRSIAINLALSGTAGTRRLLAARARR